MSYSKKEIAALRRVAATTKPMYKSLNRIQEKINKLMSEKEELCGLLNAWEKPVYEMTGYTCQDLFDMETLTLKYPETIVPPCDGRCNNGETAEEMDINAETPNNTVESEPTCPFEDNTPKENDLISNL